MFDPACCPYRSCPFHLQPGTRFFIRHGFYHPQCRNHPVPRFRCRFCGRTFSRQSFRADYRHKKPHLNATFLRLMVSCVGLRQAARALQVARRTVEHRFRWLASHAYHYQYQQLRGACLRGRYQLDELESFESNRYQPVSVPVLIERDTFFIVATAVAPLRRKGRLSALQRRRLAQYEALHGRRRTLSAKAVRAVLSRLRELVAPDGPVRLDSDRNPSYGSIGRALFGKRFRWHRHSATARRDRSNPLFPINHTNARLRHFLARLRRRTWCVSRLRECLQQHLQIAALWSNFCRGITNRTRITPAQQMGVATRPYRPEEVLGWRQDWDTGMAPVAD
jgi:hypothetical protein